MKIQKILTVTSQEKKDLQELISLLGELIANKGKEFCHQQEFCRECPFNNKNYLCPIDHLNSNAIDFGVSDIENFINELPVVEED